MAGITTPSKLIAADRRAIVWKLRKEGKTYDKVAEHINNLLGDEAPKGYDRRYAYKDVKRHLDSLKMETTQIAKNELFLDLERMDSYLEAIREKAEDGHLPSILASLKIMERKAKLLNLDKVTIYMQNYQAQLEGGGLSPDATLEQATQFFYDEHSRAKAKVSAED